LNLKKVTLRNFRSFGNIPYTFDIDEYQSTFLHGENGAGKSTSLPHSIVYCLFNKTIEQKDKLSSLINSMNKNNCVVTVEFTAKGKYIKVTRGMKPSIFEIEIDGKVLPVEATKGEHQAVLESYIGCNFSVFCNNIILTLAQFKPFIGMSVGERRETVEQFLDLTLFPLYIDKIKADIKTKKLKQEMISKSISEIQYKINASKQIVESFNGQLREASSSKEFYLDELREQYDELKAPYNELEQQKTLLLMSESKYDNVHVEYERTLNLKSGFEAKINELKSQATKYSKLKGVCVHCESVIDESITKKKVQELYDKAKVFSENLDKIKLLLDDAKKKVDEKNLFHEKISSLNSDLKDIENQRLTLESSIKRTIDELKKDSEPLKEKIFIEENKIKDLQKELMDVNDELDDCENNISTYAEALDMFSDKGIKRSIIKKYIPMLNNKVNEYLNAMGLYLNFKMDADFKVDFSSPDRNGQTANSLSSGQKRRVDLAVLLAWRHIAELKNSVKTNFLMLDEILNPLDIHGHETVIKMFKECFPEIRLFVTSQHQEFKDLFNNNIEFSLVGGFTKIN